MKEKQAFLRFIQTDKCSKEDFLLAKKYVRFNGSTERKQFVNKLFLIVKKTLNEMVNFKFNSVHDAKYVYQKYGISREFFDKSLKLFLEENNSLEVTRKYYRLLCQNNHIKLDELFDTLKIKLWNIQLIQTTANKYNISVAELNFLLASFMQNKYNISYKLFNEYQDTYIAFDSLINGQAKTKFQKENAYKYIREFSTEDEFIIFKSFANKLLDKIKIATINDQNPNSILQSYSLNDYDLYKFLVLCSDLKNKYLNMIYLRFETYYRYCRNVQMDVELIANKAKDKNLSADEFISLGQLYAHNIVNTDLYQNLPRKKFSSKAYQILEQVLAEKNIDTITMLLTQNNITNQHITNFCYLVHSEYSFTQKREVERLLLHYLKRAKDKFKSLKFLKLPIEIEEFFQKYLLENISLKDMCKKYNFDFNFIIGYMSVYRDLDLVKAVSQKDRNYYEEEALKNYKNYVYNFLTLYNYIKEGVKERGIKRMFTLIDYFRLFPNSDLHLRKVNFIKSLNATEIAAINHFFNPLKLALPINKKDIIDAEFKNGILKNKNGNNITCPLNQNEIIQIVDYLEQQHIPLNTATFQDAVDLYLINMLFTDEDSLQKNQKPLK